MIKTGLKRPKISRKDYDFVKSHKLQGIIPEFPTEYDTDNHQWMPDQDSFEPIFNNPAMYSGCTDYTQADISADIDGTLKNPAVIEMNTHANANGGADIRVSLDAARKLKWIDAYYNIRAFNLDYFDTFRLAIIEGGAEKRSVSWGTPWFREWGSAILGKNSILPTPDTSKANVAKLGWHNAKICGWKVTGGITYLRVKSWQGVNVGDNGWFYISRENFNAVMAIPSTVGYTATQNKAVAPERIDWSIWNWLLSHLGIYLPYRY